MPSISDRAYNIIENYIYIYQLDSYWILPVYPDSIQDQLGSTFSEENVLSRTAPIYSYSHSGPRSIQISLDLHRDLMTAFNYNNNSYTDSLADVLNDDYVDTLIKNLQAMSMPSYSAISTSDMYNKMLNPPMVAVRFGNDIFIKGVVNGNVGVTYSGPISDDGKYEQVQITFSVTEIEPQDAQSIQQYGSMRPLSSLLSIYKDR